MMYASLNGLLSGLSPAAAIARARQLLAPAMVSSWRFWPVVQLITFSPLIPVDLKLLWNDSMEILWVAYLSASVNSVAGDEAASEQHGAVDAARTITAAVPWGEGWLAGDRD